MRHNVITEKTFRTALNGMWYTYAAALGLMYRLEGMGLAIASPEGFGVLISIQERIEEGILELLEVDRRAGGLKEGRLLIEELNQYLQEAYLEYPECSETDVFPEECYKGLLDVMKNAGIKIPWETEG